VRRLLPPISAVVSLVVAGSAAAALHPIVRGQDGVGALLSQKRAIVLPKRTGRASMIVTLDLPPLAEATGDRSVLSASPRRKLNVSSTSSKAYLARIDAAQRRAIAELRTAIPEARVGHRYRILLDGFSVKLPARRLPKLLLLGFVEKAYRSTAYTLSMNRAPALISAPAMRSATRVGGDGVKVAVVDDGIDPRHPFLDPAGLSFPPGFPKGTPGFTTPKVIVAKAFFPDVSTAEARQPLDESSSFHGTFVSGVIGGRENTTAPASVPGTCVIQSGGCHGRIAGLSGVAPRVWLGNYRVFSLPAPLGGCCSANTPEIIAAFEAAVADGMDVVKFSGGGPESDPAGDALVAAVQNVVKAGVVPVISAGNDRDLFGLGTVGSPSTAPDAISVAATANSHIFTGSLSLTAPAAIGGVAFVPAPGTIPAAWATTDQPVTDVGAITGTDGRPVDRQLCGTTLPARSLAGSIALAVRGGCSFEAKGARAANAGAIGLVLADDRAGDPSFIPLRLGVPGGTISDLDGARLRQALGGSGGRGRVRISPASGEVPTTWGGVPASFSAGGLTAFGHKLKPDIAAPGAQIISSTLTEFAGDQYAVLDGTSFSAPHISGAAALLLQRHPAWTPQQVKSALMTTAGPAWGDTARTVEAQINVQGAGLANVLAADSPMIFAYPQSLSFGDINVAAGAGSRSLLLALSDAGGGAGTWQVDVQAQSSTAGVSVSAAPAFILGPGGQTTLQVTAGAASGATAGDQYGFLVLRKDGVARRVPYGFSVTRPLLAGAPVTPLAKLQSGDTRSGTNHASVYRWPTNPFGILSLFGVQQGPDDGAERVYSIDISAKTVNFGVVVKEPRLRIDAPVRDLLSANAPIHPWLLSSLDENSVQGYGGTPVNMNGYMPDFVFNVGAAGSGLPAPGRYYFAIDSGSDPFSGRSLAGRYVLRSWVDDVKPPVVKVLTKTLAAGRPSIVARITDANSGVDPLSLLLLYNNSQIGALAFDPDTGIAVFSLPKDVTELSPGPGFMRIVASDFQETKNLSTPSDEAMPNTRFLGFRVAVVSKPVVTWLAPTKGACVKGRTELLVAASSSEPISSVGFYDGKRQLARVRKNIAGLYRATWSAGKQGPHVLTAVASDTGGRESGSALPVRVCG